LFLPSRRVPKSRVTLRTASLFVLEKYLEIKSPFSANSSVNKALTSSLISANAAERSCLAEPAFATA
jgi:hypothetical protein